MSETWLLILGFLTLFIPIEYITLRNVAFQKERKTRRVVVVNDCGFVWEDLKPYLPENIEWQFIRRSRGWYSKTFGLLWQILRSEGDFYIVNFALQDAWLTQKLKHLDLLICHGGDLRKTLHNKKWGWMVRSNLNAAKTVAYTSEDTAEIALKHRPDAFLIHRPIRTEIYKPYGIHEHLTLCAVYFQKSYDKLPEEISQLLIEKDASLTVVQGGIPHSEIPEFLSRFDVFIDQTTNRDLSKLCLEAMSCGLCVITWKDRGRLRERVNELLSPERREMESQQNREYVMKNYDASHIALEVPKWLPQ